MLFKIRRMQYDTYLKGMGHNNILDLRIFTSCIGDNTKTVVFWPHTANMGVIKREDSVYPSR